MSSSSLSTVCGDEDYQIVKQDKRSLLCKSISNLLEQTVQDNSRLQICWDRTIFSSNRLKKKYSILQYLENLVKYTDVEESTLILSLIYIDRVCEKNQILLGEHNIYKLLLTAVLVASKTNEDDFYNNRYYSKVGKVKTSDMNAMEKEFLSFINFELYVNLDLYVKYKVYLDFYK